MNARPLVLATVYAIQSFDIFKAGKEISQMDIQLISSQCQCVQAFTSTGLLALLRA